MRDVEIAAAIVLLLHVAIGAAVLWAGGPPQCGDVETVRIGSLLFGGC